MAGIKSYEGFSGRHLAGRKIVNGSYESISQEQVSILLFSGSDTNVNANTDALTLTEHRIALPVLIKKDTLTVTTNNIALPVTVHLDALTITTFAATVNAETNVNANTASLTVTENRIALPVTVKADALTISELQATISLGVVVDANVDALTLTEYAATVLYEGEQTGGGSTKSAKAEQERQRAYNKKLKALQQKEVKERVKKAKPKKVIKVDLKKQLKVAEQDAKWVKEVIDRPFELPGGHIDNELRLRDQTARAEANRKMEQAIQARLAFIRDEEEAIAQILLMMI